MDVITVKGVEYQRASVLAKKFKYTSDYIGQLCRGKKVDAQLVGRSWYVNPESLKSHKKSRYVAKSSSDEKDNINKVEINKSRIDVEPFLNKKAIKTINSANKNFAKRIDWKPVRYEFDESELLPRLSEPRKLKVDLAESSPIAITKSTRNTILEAEALPTVSLGGTLIVTSLEETFEVDDEIEQQSQKKPVFKEDIKEKVLTKKEVISEYPAKSKPKPRKEDKNETFSVKIREEKMTTLVVKEKSESETGPRLNKLDRKALVPLRVQESEVIVKKQKLQKTLSWFVILFLLILLLSVLLLEIEVTSDDVSSVTNFNFNFNFLNDFKQLFSL